MSVFEREARVRLKALIDRLNAEKGLPLMEVARLARVSSATLRRAHRKFDAPVSGSTLRGLERAYGLGYRELDVFLATPGYEPRPASRPLDPKTSKAEDVVRFLNVFTAVQPAEAQKLNAQIDAIW